MSYIYGVAPRNKPYVMAQYLPIARGGFSDERMKLSCYAGLHRQSVHSRHWPQQCDYRVQLPFRGGKVIDLFKRSHATKTCAQPGRV